MKKFLFLVLFLGIFSFGGSVTAAVCPTSCIDINTACPTGTSVAAQTCPSSNLKCCTSAGSGETPLNNATDAQCQTAGGACKAGACGTGDQNLGSCSFQGSFRYCCKAAGGTEHSFGSTSAVNFNLANPLKYDTVEGVLTSIMGGIKGIVVTLALLMIVIGGVLYILSLGNAENMKRAKSIILAALIGLAIVIAAPAFLKEISTLLGWDNAPAIEGGTNLTLTQIARNVLNFLLAIIGTLAIIMLIISGILYLTSAGNENRMKQAKSIFIASLIGIAVAMASLILVSAVARFFE